MTAEYKYQPARGFIPGIPARDLTAMEFDALTDEQKNLAIKSGTYLAPVEKSVEFKTDEKKDVNHDNSK